MKIEALKVNECPMREKMQKKEKVHLREDESVSLGLFKLIDVNKAGNLKNLEFIGIIGRFD